MGFSDGVSKLWIVRTRGGLDVDGFKDEPEAIDRLIRTALTRAAEEQLPDLKARIGSVVADALKHCDPEPPKPRKCNRHDDCDAANDKARAQGYLAADHCHDEDCEDCFGT